MARRLPPLNGLKAFEAAARGESFTRAADELNVTQGAISHQVKSLEDTLGFKLFHRERQRVILTEAGRDYLNIIHTTCAPGDQEKSCDSQCEQAF
jgi:LysR family glycine cleavage system transcriptional activator